MQIKKTIAVVGLSSLAACASLPRSGPTGIQLEKTLDASATTSRIELVEVANIGDVPHLSDATPSILLPQSPPPPTDRVGPGDVLDINIYEAGVALFAGSGSAIGATSTAGAMTQAPGVQLQKLPPCRVDDNGDIIIPYAGKLHVEGRTIGDIQVLIQHSLRRLSQNPQVLITLAQPITNSVIVSGEFTRPGRLVLQTNRETISDVIALAGGYRGNVRDLLLRIVRGEQSVSLRVQDLAEDPSLDVRAVPGDRFVLISDPRSFSVLGAAGRVDQLPFTRSNVSLAEAVAVAGGVNPNFGDPRAVFLFRYVKDASGVERPVVYHLNMMRGATYFLAQKFKMADKDVLYFGNASANQPSKLFQLVSQLFTPLVTVTAAAQALNN